MMGLRMRYSLIHGDIPVGSIGPVAALLVLIGINTVLKDVSMFGKKQTILNMMGHLAHNQNPPVLTARMFALQRPLSVGLAWESTLRNTKPSVSLFSSEPIE